jgi:transcriptional regulator with XRE-family HTH domain
MGRRITPQVRKVGQRFGDNLLVLRNRVDLSQEQTAVRAGLHLTEIGLLERGQRLPRLDTVVKLAGAVEAEPCELLAGMSWRAGQLHRGSWVRQNGAAPEGAQAGEDG